MTDLKCIFVCNVFKSIQNVLHLFQLVLLKVKHAKILLYRNIFTLLSSFLFPAPEFITLEILVQCFSTGVSRDFEYKNDEAVGTCTKSN